MTEKLPPLSTRLATPGQTVPSADKAIPAKEAPLKVEPVEDRIKCICGYSDDDGTTIFCEQCKTWQHVYCYYLTEAEADEALQERFDHSCQECKPRQLDTQAAVERMRERLRMSLVDADSYDKKSKRPPSKPQKKKVKPTDLQLNGHVNGTEGPKRGSPHDHPPAKKSKTSHKSSQSVSSQGPKRSPSHSAPRVHQSGHPLSPATTPPDLPYDFDFQNPHPHFFALALYHESDAQIADTNTHANLKTRDRMSLWLKPDHDCFRKDTGREFKDVIQTTSPPPLNPPLRLESKDYRQPKGSKTLHWQYLTAPSAIEKDVPMMELNGLVGLQKDYCDEPDNRWAELSAPLPYVFFPPSLPLYIDTRKEGSNARYVRRSCKPNAQLETYLSDGSEYHFWLVSDRPISANEQITLPWDFRFPNQERMVRLLGLGDEEANGPPITDIDQSECTLLVEWIQRILAEYGGCACDLGSDCALVRFHRNYLDKVQQRPNPQKRKRVKPKPHTISPIGTDQATNSRAASEGHLDEVPENDGNSAAGSSRSKPPSRDRTPARHGSFDTLGILTEPTNRDKRKVQIAENLFQKSAQEHQPPRKKKKTSADGTTNPSASRSKGRNSISHAGTEERSYVDVGTCGSKSVSPTNTLPAINTTFRHPSVPSVSRRSSAATAAPRSYCDAATQTEPVAGKWSNEESPKFRRPRRIVSLTMRLMAQKRRDSLDVQERSASVTDLGSPATTKSSQGSPSVAHKQLPLSSPSSAPGSDTPMLDAPSANTGATSPLLSNGTGSAVSPNKVKSPELRVQMPPVPAFTSPNSATAVSTTPISANGSVLHSPFSATNLPSSFAPVAVNGVAATPSPVKKKMSLSEYKSKANKAAAFAKPALDNTHPLKTTSSSADTSRPTTNGDEGAKDSEKLPSDLVTKDMTTTVL